MLPESRCLSALSAITNLTIQSKESIANFYGQKNFALRHGIFTAGDTRSTDMHGLYLVAFSKPSSRQPHPSLSEMRNASCILPSLSPEKSANSISLCSKEPDGLSVPQESGQRFLSFYTVLQAADLS